MNRKERAQLRRQRCTLRICMLLFNASLVFAIFYILHRAAKPLLP